MRWGALIIWVVFLGAVPLRAVEMNSGYDTTPPTVSLVPNWNIGWGPSNVSCWNYIGEVNGASGVYLGNGWVMTAAHIGVGSFTLTTGPGAGTYKPVTGTTHSISSSEGTADLVLFQVASPPNLAPLIISQNPPVAFSLLNPGTSVVMFGYGGGKGLTWGMDIVTDINMPVTPTGYTYISDDFLVNNGLITEGSLSITNSSTLVTGDSGGGTFSFNTTTQKWELAGINEVTGTYMDSTVTFSGMVELSNYASQIAAVLNPPLADTPTLPLPALLIMAGLLVLAASSTFARKTEPFPH